MHLLLDHITAVIIGGAILLMALTVYQSDREALTEATAFYAMIRHQEDFARTVTNDLQSIEEVYAAEMDADGRFVIKGFIGASSTSYEIAYVREVAREVDGIRYYRIRRYTRFPGALTWKEEGGSADVITDWTIEGRDASGNIAGTPAGITQLFVRFEVGSRLSPRTREALGETARVTNTVWEASFFPPLLQ